MLKGLRTIAYFKKSNNLAQQNLLNNNAVPNNSIKYFSKSNNSIFLNQLKAKEDRKIKYLLEKNSKLEDSKFSKYLLYTKINSSFLEAYTLVPKYLANNSVLIQNSRFFKENKAGSDFEGSLGVSPYNITKKENDNNSRNELIASTPNFGFPKKITPFILETVASVVSNVDLMHVQLVATWGAILCLVPGVAFVRDIPQLWLYILPTCIAFIPKFTSKLLFHSIEESCNFFKDLIEFNEHIFDMHELKLANSLVKYGENIYIKEDWKEAYSPEGSYFTNKYMLSLLSARKIKKLIKTIFGEKYFEDVYLSPEFIAKLNGMKAIKLELDVYKTNKFHDYKLVIECINNNIVKLKKTLEKHKNPNAESENGWKLLHIAAFNNNTEMVKLLIEQGADINAENDNGETPVMVAAKNGCAEVVKPLCENGADLNIKDSDDNYIVNIAYANKMNEVAELLMKYNADIIETKYNQACEFYEALYRPEVAGENNSFFEEKD
jgi:ankyrin repeat protein